LISFSFGCCGGGGWCARCGYLFVRFIVHLLVVVDAAPHSGLLVLSPLILFHFRCLLLVLHQPHGSRPFFSHLSISKKGKVLQPLYLRV
jgi:hypothetical protein